MSQEPKVEPINPMEKERGGRKKPLVSCEKYDEEERKTFIEEQEKAEEKVEEKEEVAHVEPIHPSEKERGGKKRSLLDTCK
ncbi:TPA: hypothetical protein HA351_05175 [Methanosarcinaceae archaeon]|nr:hypothetical protein [Methanosarcinaceae archaeon]